MALTIPRTNTITGLLKFDERMFTWGGTDVGKALDDGEALSQTQRTAQRAVTYLGGRFFSGMSAAFHRGIALGFLPFNQCGLFFTFTRSSVSLHVGHERGRGGGLLLGESTHPRTRAVLDANTNNLPACGTLEASAERQLTSNCGRTSANRCRLAIIN